MSGSDRPPDDRPTQRRHHRQSVGEDDGKRGIKGFDAGKKVKGRKRHLIVDTLGLVLRALVHSAGLQDNTGGASGALLHDLGTSRNSGPLIVPPTSRLKQIWADGGYRGATPLLVARASGWTFTLVKRDPEKTGFATLPKRWIVERAFGWLNRYRGPSKHYEFPNQKLTDHDLPRHDQPHAPPTRAGMKLTSHTCSEDDTDMLLPMRLRLATESDLPAINDIYNHYVRTSTTTYQEIVDTLDDRRAWFRNREPRHVVTVAEIDGVVVGWASLNVFRARSAYRFSCENSVYVHHEYFRRGIGGALLLDSIARAKQHGFKTIVAGIDAEQLGSITLHQKHGFSPVGTFTQIGYKFDRWLDATFMQLML